MLSPLQFEPVAARLRTPGEGATIDVHTGRERNSGWAVAMADHEHTTGADALSGRSLHDYSSAHRGALEQTGHMGLWHNPDDSKVYHDATRVFPDSGAGGAAAVASGHLNHQLSVYNMDRGDMIHMNPTQPSHLADNRSAMRGLRKQRPSGRPISEMPTADLAQAFRSRR